MNKVSLAFIVLVPLAASLGSRFAEPAMVDLDVRVVHGGDLRELRSLLTDLAPDLEIQVKADSMQLRGNPGAVEQGLELVSLLDKPLNEIVIRCGERRLSQKAAGLELKLTVSQRVAHYRLHNSARVPLRYEMSAGMILGRDRDGRVLGDWFRLNRNGLARLVPLASMDVLAPGKSLEGSFQMAWQPSLHSLDQKRVHEFKVGLEVYLDPSLRSCVHVESDWLPYR